MTEVGDRCPVNVVLFWVMLCFQVLAPSSPIAYIVLKFFEIPKFPLFRRFSSPRGILGCEIITYRIRLTLIGSDSPIKTDINIIEDVVILRSYRFLVVVVEVVLADFVMETLPTE